LPDTRAKLYVILGSHACRTGILLMEHKGIPYKQVTLPTGFHPAILPFLGFHGSTANRSVDGRRPPSMAMADRMGTVPALRYDGQRVDTNIEIARFLDRVKPDPPLFPAEPERRAAVEEAERWGDAEFQMLARRLVLGAIFSNRESVSQAADGRMGPLLWHHEATRLMGMRVVARFFRVSERREAALRATLPGALDRIDAWVESGVLNGPELYAADLMIAPSLALLCYRDDLRPEIESRPALALVDRVLPEPAPQAA
jgi:glutathione S-transferase